LIEDTNQLVGKVYEYFDTTLASLSNKQRGPVLAGVMHRASKIIDFDINNVRPGEEVIPELHPLMQDRLNNYLEQARTRGLGEEALGKDLPGIHAEVKAASRVLNALEAELGRPATGDDLDDLLIFNIRTIGGKKGQTIIRCPNSQVLTKYILSISDLPEEFIRSLSNYREP
jgi:hypothetical protein